MALLVCCHVGFGKSCWWKAVDLSRTRVSLAVGASVLLSTLPAALPAAAVAAAAAPRLPLDLENEKWGE